MTFIYNTLLLSSSPFSSHFFSPSSLSFKKRKENGKKKTKTSWLLSPLPPRFSPPPLSFLFFSCSFEKTPQSILLFLFFFFLPSPTFPFLFLSLFFSFLLPLSQLVQVSYFQIEALQEEQGKNLNEFVFWIFSLIFLFFFLRRVRGFVLLSLQT